MVYNRTQHPPHALPAKHRLYILNCDTGKRGGDEPERRRGNNSQSWVEKTNMTDCITSL
jgi:hypothetical protein